MASYSSQDFNTMQEEALRRMREMQKKSRGAVNGETEHAKKEDKPQNDDQHTSQSSNFQRQDILKSLFGDIKPDPEKMLILLMLFVLYKNKADIKLLIALGYLLI